jgi:hypothetical protein
MRNDFYLLLGILTGMGRPDEATLLEVFEERPDADTLRLFKKEYKGLTLWHMTSRVTMRVKEPLHVP